MMIANLLRLSTNLVVIVAGVSILGCSTIHSTHVAKDQSACGWKTRHLRGIPTKIKVPTHLELRIYEKQFARRGNDNNKKDVLVYIPELTSYRVVPKIIEKEEIFTVDPVRPAAGLGYSETTLNAKNSIASLKGKIEDQTLQALTYSLDKLSGVSSPAAPGRDKVGTIPTPSTSTSVQKKAGAANIYELETLVAAQWFDLSDPMLDANMQQFLRDRLNACQHPCIPTPAGAPVPTNPIVTEHSEKALIVPTVGFDAR